MSTTTFYVTSPRKLVVYMVYFIVECYILQDTGGTCIYVVLHCYINIPRVLVVYMVYYIILCYIFQGTGGVYDVPHRSMVHRPGYWWYILSLCIVTFYVISPRVLVGCMVHFIVLCFISQGIGGVYRVSHLSVLHQPGYWLYVWCTSSFYVTSPNIERCSTP